MDDLEPNSPVALQVERGIRLMFVSFVFESLKDKGIVSMKQPTGIVLAVLLCASRAANAQLPADPALTAASQPSAELAPPAEAEPPAETRTVDVGDMLHVVLHRDTAPAATDPANGTSSRRRRSVRSPRPGSAPGSRATWRFTAATDTHISSVSAG